MHFRKFTRLFVSESRTKIRERHLCELRLSRGAIAGYIVPAQASLRCRSRLSDTPRTGTWRVIAGCPHEALPGCHRGVYRTGSGFTSLQKSPVRHTPRWHLASHNYIMVESPGPCAGRAVTATSGCKAQPEPLWYVPHRASRAELLVVIARNGESSGGARTGYI